MLINARHSYFLQTSFHKSSLDVIICLMKIRLAVFRGGPSNEYEVSLRTGQNVLSALSSSEKYDLHDVLIDKNGTWHLDGVPITPQDLVNKIDVGFNALHGEYGEDGTIQKILENIRIPFTGSGSLSSALGMNKSLAKYAFKQQGIKTPIHITLSKIEATEEKLHDIFRSFPFPNVVKPLSSGSFLGISIVKTFQDLKNAVEKAFEYSPVALIEEYISGKDISCGVINDFRGQELYALIPTENGACPSSLNESDKEAVIDAAKKIHQVLGLRHYSHSDFVVHPRRGIYALEVNTLPGLHQESILPKSLAAVGCTLPEFLDHVIDQALGR